MLPSRRAPIVTQVVVYKVGSADEAFGHTGAAHFLEHMMFKGTDKVPSGEFSRIVSRNGGRDNAYTTFDSTGYHQTIAAERLELVMRMEADRMTNVRITEREIVPERQVILEERRMRTDNVPASLLDEAVREQLYGRHKPYAMPIIGYVDDIKRAGRQRSPGLLSPLLRAQQRHPDRGRRHHDRTGAQAGGAALRADRQPQDRAAARGPRKAAPTCRRR